MESWDSQTNCKLSDSDINQPGYVELVSIKNLDHDGGSSSDSYLSCHEDVSHAIQPQTANDVLLNGIITTQDTVDVVPIGYKNNSEGTKEHKLTTTKSSSKNKKRTYSQLAIAQDIIYRDANHKKSDTLLSNKNTERITESTTLGIGKKVKLTL
ncbi:hypothetical protein TrispH2_004351, partial [Trichoplax sp. H2]